MANAVASEAIKLGVQETSFLCGVPDEVEFLREDVRSLQTFLSEDAGSGRGGAVAADSIRRIRDAVYDAENVLEAVDYRKKMNNRRKGLLGAMMRYSRKPIDLVACHRLGNDIIRVRRRITGVKSISGVLKAVDAAGSHVAPSAREHEPNDDDDHLLLRAPPTMDDSVSMVIGFEDDAKKISDWLMDSENLQLTFVSIVALGGAGKTTLARKVYSSATDQVEKHFIASASVSISQQFKPLHVLKEITKQATGIKSKHVEFDSIAALAGQLEELDKMGKHELVDKMRRKEELLVDKMGREELTEYLHNFLKDKRYLIVLDDVWRENTWAAIQKAFPDSGNGSRVILTTRSLDVANQANKFTHVHHLGLLKDEESLELFCRHAFPLHQDIDAREDLEKIGENLVKKCNGLPLALVVLGSHLSKKLNRDTWSKMNDFLDWEGTKSWKNMEKIIALSYGDLPSRYLKSCFLYMASFPEDFVLEAKNLTRSWIAEGFVPSRDNHTLEETADVYLEELIQRSMIHTCYWEKDDIFGLSLHVQMHDVLREWAVQEARREEFLKVCKNHGEVPDGTMSPGYYRLSFLGFFNEQIFIPVPNLRSMLGFHLSYVTLGKLRFLRTLYMVDSDLRGVSNVIGLLIHLRYIALIGCRNVVLPSSIGRLLNLQSIDLTKTETPRVPKSLWSIPTLRHVKIHSTEAFTPTITEEQSQLQTLSCIGGLERPGSLMEGHGNRFVRLLISLNNTPQLRVLELLTSIVLPVRILTCFLSDHHHLYHLSLFVWGDRHPFDKNILLPQNLRHLFLKFNGNWNKWHTNQLLPTLGRLTNLVQLSLMAIYRQDSTEEDRGAWILSGLRLNRKQRYSKSEQRRDREILSTDMYEAPIIDSPADGFLQLQYLMLGGVQANKLRFHNGTMPKLVELTLTSSHMTTIPDGLLGLESLEELKLDGMVNKLPGETHQLLQGNGIRVTIEDE